MRSVLLSKLADIFIFKTAKKSFKYTEFDDGIVICADSCDPKTVEFVKTYLNKQKIKQVDLILIDPPYGGGIVKDSWDQIKTNQQQFVDWMFDWTKLWWSLLKDNGAFYCWGGTGIYQFHPFFLYLTQAEHREDINMYLADVITWAKSRSYGSRKKYLYTREELAYFLKGDENNPRIFNVPYLDQLRGYPGFNLKYPALSPYFRRKNVWLDIKELFSGKYHSCQKPLKVMEIPIEVHTNKGGWVIDYFAGSGATAFAARNLGRNFVLVEQDPINYKNIVKRLKTFKVGDKLK